MIGTLLSSKPIRELEVNALDTCYVDCVRFYLEHELGASLTYIQNGWYLVKFPEGSREETYAGHSTSYTSETTIRLPSGETLKKLILYPLNEQQRKLTGLAFPTRILEDA